MVTGLSWNYETDILIVGSGVAGMTAALRCYDLGANPLVIEKSDHYGGSSAVSAGLMWVPCNDQMVAAGIPDSIEESLSYLKSLCRDEVPEEQLHSWVENGRDLLRYLEDNTRLRFEALCDWPDDHPHLPGSKSGGRLLEPVLFAGSKLSTELASLPLIKEFFPFLGYLNTTMAHRRKLVRRDKGWFKLLLRYLWRYFQDNRLRLRAKYNRTLSMGNALIGALRFSLLDRNIPVWLSCSAQELIVENDRILGLRITKDGETFCIKATKAVVLAAGGFEANQDMRQQWLTSHGASEWSAASGQGEALTMGLEAGATMNAPGQAWWWPTVRMPKYDFALPLFLELGFPGGCLINQKGERFVNETTSGSTIVQHMLDGDDNKRSTSQYYLVFGKYYRKNFACGPIPPSAYCPDIILPQALRQQFIYKSQSITGLAAEMGVDAKGLKNTIDKMNQFASAGEDEDFQRGSDANKAFYGKESNKLNPCLAPIKAPFYGVRVYPGDLGTCSGLGVDARSRVVDNKNQVIEGLYAVGNCSAPLRTTANLGLGGSIGLSMAFSFVAANDIMCGV